MAFPLLARLHSFRVLAFGELARVGTLCVRVGTLAAPTLRSLAKIGTSRPALGFLPLLVGRFRLTLYGVSMWCME